MAGRADVARGASGASNHGPNRDRVSGAPRIMFGMPLWTGAAHVVQLRPVGVEQGLGQTVQEVGDVGAKGRSLAAGSEHPNRGPNRDHDTCPLGSSSFRLLHSLVGQRAKPSGSISGRSAALNLGKTSPLRSYASVVFLA
jgi:hypothetical protein